MSNTINPIAQRVAREFVMNFRHQLPDELKEDLQDTEDGLHLWLTNVIASAQIVRPCLTSYKLVNYLREWATGYYEAFLELPTDSPADRVTYVESLCHGLLMTMQADDSLFSIHQAWYDALGVGINRAVYCSEKLDPSLL